MALKDLEKQYNRDPKSRKFFPLAEEYAKLGNLEKAMDLLRRGLMIHPAYMGARVALGRVMIQLGKSDQARNELEKVIDLVPDNIMAHSLLGKVYEEQELLEKALERFKMVLLLNPDDEVTRSRVANLKKRLSVSRRPQEAAQAEQATYAAEKEPVRARAGRDDISFELPEEKVQQDEMNISVEKEEDMELGADDISFDLPDADVRSMDEQSAGEVDAEKDGTMPALSELLEAEQTPISEQEKVMGFVRDSMPDEPSLFGPDGDVSFNGFGGEDTFPAASGFETDSGSEKPADESRSEANLGESSGDVQFDLPNGELAFEGDQMQESATEYSTGETPAGAVASASPGDIEFDIPGETGADVSDTPSEVSTQKVDDEMEGISFDLPDDELEEAHTDKGDEDMVAVQIPDTETQQSGSIQTLSLARVYINQGYYDRSEEIIRSILRQEPNDQQALSMLKEIQQLQETTIGKRIDESGQVPWQGTIDSTEKEKILHILEKYLKSVQAIKTERGMTVQN